MQDRADGCPEAIYGHRGLDHERPLIFELGPAKGRTR